MKTYIYKATSSSDQRGYNRTITCYRVINNQPMYIGYNDKINTASYKGDYAIACQLISKVDHCKMEKDGYGLQSKHINVISV